MSDGPKLAATTCQHEVPEAADSRPMINYPQGTLRNSPFPLVRSAPGHGRPGRLLVPNQRTRTPFPNVNLRGTFPDGLIAGQMLRCLLGVQPSSAGLSTDDGDAEDTRGASPELRFPAGKLGRSSRSTSVWLVSLPGVSGLSFVCKNAGRLANASPSPVSVPVLAGKSSTAQNTVPLVVGKYIFEAAIISVDLALLRTT